MGGLTADYFLVLPTLLPKLAPANPPVMEGVFNGLVAWAALLAFGFLEDGRKPVRVIMLCVCVCVFLGEPCVYFLFMMAQIQYSYSSVLTPYPSLPLPTRNRRAARRIYSYLSRSPRSC